MPDIDYGEVFGLDRSESQGTDPNAGAAEKPGTEADSAGTAEKSGETGAPDAGTAQTEENAPGTEAESGEGGQSGEAPAATGAQSSEENARFAAARRKAERERDEAIAAARAEMQREIDEVFKNSGMVNPYTKKPITSRAEYDEYRTRYDEEQRSRVMRKAGMSDEEFDTFVNGLPQVRQAKEAAAAAERAQQQAKIEGQLKEIGEMDPSIKSLDDLTHMENYDRFYAYVKRGNSLADAYRLVNFDKLVNRTAAAGRQAAMNAAAGKAHMGRTSARGQGAVDVPSDVMEQYRMLNPEATDADIRAHYAKYHRSK